VREVLNVYRFASTPSLRHHRAVLQERNMFIPFNLQTFTCVLTRTGFGRDIPVVRDVRGTVLPSQKVKSYAR
jgi:hypothetical protein